MKRLLLICLTGILLLGCTEAKVPDDQIMDGDGMMNSYVKITQEEAQYRMKQDDGHVVVDVRRQDEYDAGHIPGAICIPNESIGAERPAQLADLNQIILVYCRSGNRSKEAAQKLFDLGYSHVYEFGGILDWTGEITTGEEVPLADPVPIFCIGVGDTQFTATLESNSSADALLERLSTEPLELTLHDYGNFEKVGALPYELPTNDERITTMPGDVILYQGDQITIYYDENTWSFTRLARIENVTQAELKAALGDGDVTVRFWIEWTE